MTILGEQEPDRTFAIEEFSAFFTVFMLGKAPAYIGGNAGVERTIIGFNDVYAPIQIRLASVLLHDTLTQAPRFRTCNKHEVRKICHPQ